MLRSLFSAAAIFFLLFTSCFLPSRVSARSRCPVKMPETLLSLYQNSDAIYIAAFDKKVDVNVLENTPDYSSVNIKKHFSISSTLKGESRKFVVLDETEYRYPKVAETPADVPAETPDEEEMEDPEASMDLQPGDTLLLFLKDGDEGDAPTLTDYRDGTKKLSMEHIGVYESRIKELNSIFSEKQVSDAKLIEWLIRCAEDPVTRWEGTFELLQSVQALEWQETAAEQRRERIARGEPVEEEALPETEVDGEEGEGEPPNKNVDTTNFAKLIDAGQKQTLANLLLNGMPVRQEAGAKKAAEIAGDEELIELVKRWGDPRLVGFLLDQLKADGGVEQYSAAKTMTMIAEILSNKDVEKLAEKYSEIAYEDDNGEAVRESEDADEVADPATAEAAAEPVLEPDVEAPTPAVEVEAEALPAESKEGDGDKPAKITYKELRQELRQKFILLCDRVIAGEDKNMDAKTPVEAT